MRYFHGCVPCQGRVLGAPHTGDDVNSGQGAELISSRLGLHSQSPPGTHTPIFTMVKPIAIIAGAGPGTGSAVARRFARAYPVVLLARSQSLDALVQDIQGRGGSAIGIPTDVTSASSMTSTIDQIKANFGADVRVAAAIYNVASKFTRKPFLEQSSEDFVGSLAPSIRGAFHFAQATLPLMLGADQTPYPPTLIFTGMLQQSDSWIDAEWNS